jgi:hypothetical protein
MPENKPPAYKKYLTYFKDSVYIITIIIGLLFYMRDANKHEAIMETTVKNNTETLIKVEDFMQNQATLNGKFIQYMAMDSHN